MFVLQVVASYLVGTVGVKRPGREAGHSPPSSARVEYGGAIPPLPHMSYLVKQRDNFTFLSLTLRSGSTTWLTRNFMVRRLLWTSSVKWCSAGEGRLYIEGRVGSPVEGPHPVAKVTGAEALTQRLTVLMQEWHQDIQASYMNSKRYSLQESQDSSVSVVSDTGLMIGVRFPAGTDAFPHPSSYPVDTGGSFPGPWSWPLTFMEFCLHSPIRLHAMVLFPLRNRSVLCITFLSKLKRFKRVRVLCHDAVWLGTNVSDGVGWEHCLPLKHSYTCTSLHGVVTADLATIDSLVQRSSTRGPRAICRNCLNWYLWQSS
jgi:hypothetical protein